MLREPRARAAPAAFQSPPRRTYLDARAAALPAPQRPCVQSANQPFHFESDPKLADIRLVHNGEVRERASAPRAQLSDDCASIHLRESERVREGEREREHQGSRVSVCVHARPRTWQVCVGVRFGSRALMVLACIKTQTLSAVLPKPIAPPACG